MDATLSGILIAFNPDPENMFFSMIESTDPGANVTANVDDVQLEKADGPMETTVAAMDTLPRLVHPEKAEAPMLVPDADMVAGIDMTLRPAPANAESPMLTRLELAANVTANVDDVQPVKADVPIEVTPAAMDTLPRLVHPEKAEAPMLVPDADMAAKVTITRFVDDSKALSPMLVTLLGISFISWIPEPEKASLPIDTSLLPGLKNT